MKNKKFDCVQMKRTGAEVVLKKTSTMSRKEELDFWRQQTQALATQQKQIKEQIQNSVTK